MTDLIMTDITPNKIFISHHIMTKTNVLDLIMMTD